MPTLLFFPILFSLLRSLLCLPVAILLYTVSEDWRNSKLGFFHWRLVGNGWCMKHLTQLFINCFLLLSKGFSIAYMAQSRRGRGFRWGGGYRRSGPYSMRGRPRPPLLSSWTRNDNHSDASSDDSMQPPSIVLETEVANPILGGNTSRDDNDNENEENVSEPIPSNVAPRRRGHGLAKCIEFDKLRKHGKIPLMINDGQTAPCCENATMFTTRVTWILKHHANMSYARWSDVPTTEKDELIDRVQGDFILDWELVNHRRTVWKQLRKRFNAFHHELHNKYLSYGSHEEALAGGTELVWPLVWVKLCGRWGSEAFKKMSKQNKENHNKLKTNHTAGRKSFVRILEEKMQMVGKMDDLTPEERTEEAAASVFREVLGYRPGYARGLGEMVILESTSRHERERDKR